MGLQVRVSGAEQFKQLSRLFKDLDRQGLGKQMSRAISTAVQPIAAAVTAEAGKTAPSGYRDTLTRSMRHRRATRVTSTQASLRLTFFAKGKGEERDLRRINLGELRHPVFGRSRRTKKGRKRNPWAATRVRAGFFDRGTKNAADEAEKRLWGVIDHYKQIITGG